MLLVGFFTWALNVHADEDLYQVSEQTDEKMEEADLDAGKIIIGHIVDAYEWHIADYGHTHISVPLPVILYDQGEWHFFMSSKFHHGHQNDPENQYQNSGFHQGKRAAWRRVCIQGLHRPVPGCRPGCRLSLLRLSHR